MFKDWYYFLSWVEDDSVNMRAIEHLSGGKYVKDMNNYIEYGIICEVGKNELGEALYGLTELGKQAVIGGVDKYGKYLEKITNF